MPSKTYSEEFKRDAVALHESSPEASIQPIATDRGVNSNALQNRLKKYGTGAHANIPTTERPSPHSVTEAERIHQLEREVSRLREERDILRKAAKYFAEETNW